MQRQPLPQQFRPARRVALTMAALFAAGIAAASTVGSSAAAPEDDCVLGLVCPGVTVPTLPTATLPLPTTPTTTTTATTSATPSSTPAQSAPPAAGTGGSQTQAADEPFTYTIVQISARRTGPVRWIRLQLTLSKAATVVAILHRSNVPSIIAVRAARTGTTKLTVTVPRRVRAGRYSLKVVLGTGVDQYAVTRTISIPR